MRETFDPLAADSYRDPFALYRELRDEAPVFRAVRPGADDVYCVSRFEDVSAVLKDTDAFSSRAMFSMLFNNGEKTMRLRSWKMLKAVFRINWTLRSNPFGFGRMRTLIADDGERHTGMRSIVNRGFSPHQVSRLEARAREIVSACVAPLRAGEPFDAVRDLAIPLPVTLIAELLGVPTERLADFKRWSDTFIHNATGPGRLDPFNEEFVNNVIEMSVYLQEIVKERRAAPRDDLVSQIVAQRDGDAALNDLEIRQFVMLLLVAGNETTTNLIGNAVRTLSANRDVLARAAADPSLIPAVIEETLRYEAPIQVVFRITTRDVELAGTKIPKDAYVMPMLGSANRDERRFPDPDRFDPERDTRGHFGFGFGKHFCLGASLARLEARAALEGLLPELARHELADKEPALVDSFLVRGPKQLELRV